MRLLILISILTLFLQAQDILIINSNSNIQKYKETEVGFSKSINGPFKTLDISGMSSSEIREYLYTEYPDIVYAIGAKAYQYANQYIPEKKIYFSSIMNWKRLDINGERYGASQELFSEMHLTLIKSIFNDIKTIGIVYSNYTEDVMQDFSDNAQKLGIKILTQKVSKSSIAYETFDDIFTKTEAMIILPDPILLSNDEIVENLFKLSKKYKKPVFAYHELFIEYGAALITSVDNLTTGRQIATMINSIAKIGVHKKILYPAGTKVIFNKKVVLNLELKFNNNSTSVIAEVIE
ncbi:ABC transporter substrate binding protein [Sulfurimonas sp.]|uniref:ABC transporter substrate binding protein n=1 Tax=Sulfurimonas sp. TaxID=2022749 RepID=UPI0025E292AA|nr:ABC transporter substrate binding protein [Sulfurimonas sp.]